jgi:hypothetical protein
MFDESMPDVRVKDPAPGDRLEVDGQRFHVDERCPCDRDAQHIRWFLSSEEGVEGLPFPESATLAKEWDDEDGEIWWWFGLKVSASDLRTGDKRLPQWLRAQPSKPPAGLWYEGKRYRLAGTIDPPEVKGDTETVPLALWEYVDADDIESLLVERSPEGDLTVYHGAYYDPADLHLVPR